jgi:hypothetical protein
MVTKHSAEPMPRVSAGTKLSFRANVPPSSSNTKPRMSLTSQNARYQPTAVAVVPKLSVRNPNQQPRASLSKPGRYNQRTLSQNHRKEQDNMDLEKQALFSPEPQSAPVVGPETVPAVEEAPIAEVLHQEDIEPIQMEVESELAGLAIGSPQPVMPVEEEEAQPEYNVGLLLLANDTLVHHLEECERRRTQDCLALRSERDDIKLELQAMQKRYNAHIAKMETTMQEQLQAAINHIEMLNAKLEEAQQEETLRVRKTSRRSYE